MLLEFLESLGVEFEIDWDNEVFINVSEDGISYAEIKQALQPVGKRLVWEVLYRAKARRSVFVGGSLNGQVVGSRVRGIKSGWVHTMADGRYGYWLRHRIGRGRWEVYEQGDADGRAFFRGYATNEQKARQGEVAERPARACGKDNDKANGNRDAD